MTTVTTMTRVFICALLLLGQMAYAHPGDNMEAMTDDGRRVMLKEDHTWTFVEVVEGDPENSAVLSVTQVQEMHDACLLQLRLKNNMKYKIRSLVPRLSVYNMDGILYESASKSFASIKPTRDQYTKVQFTGIGCHEISLVKVHDASRCRMGEIDMFNEEEGQCLKRIYVEPSDLINISK